jgi:hypothetical protein
MGGDAIFTGKQDSVFSSSGNFKEGTYRRVIHEMEEMAMINMGQYALGNHTAHDLPLQLRRPALEIAKMGAYGHGRTLQCQP